MLDFSGGRRVVFLRVSYFEIFKMGRGLRLNKRASFQLYLSGNLIIVYIVESKGAFLSLFKRVLHPVETKKILSTNAIF